MNEDKAVTLTAKAVAPGLDNIIRLSLIILDWDPCDIESMLIIANHREHPRVKLSLADTIAMLEWARELAPANVFIPCIIVRLYAETYRYETN
jgi:hypothetical protein